MTTPADLSYAMSLYADEVARQKAIVKARAYHDGRQPTALTDRLREFLGLHPGAQSSTTGGIWSDRDDAANPFVLNVSRVVVNAVTERLLIAGFDTDEDAQDATTRASLPRPVADWAWQLWQDNRMDAKQDDTDTDTIRDGEAFVIVDWDAENARPRFTPHPAYTDAQEAGGDGFGCKVFYPDDDPFHPPEFATKRWTARQIDDRGKRTTIQRLNVYYPERIEQFVLAGGDWQPYDRPIPWVGPAGPLGVAVVPFANVGCRAEAWDALPLQDALNKSLIDLITAADVTAFRIMAAFGWIPTADGLAPQTDGSNALFVQPGMIIGTTKSKNEADLKAIEGANLDQLVNVIQNLILWIAMVTDTPLNRFTQTRQIAAEGTLKQQEAVLLGKIRKRQARIGNGWEDCLALARRLENTFGAGGLDEDVTISARWESAETRDELAERQALQVEQQLGVPDEVLWAKLGYSPSEIDAMRQQKQEQAAQDFERQQQLIGARAGAAVPFAGNGKAG